MLQRMLKEFVRRLEVAAISVIAKNATRVFCNDCRHSNFCEKCYTSCCEECGHSNYCEKCCRRTAAISISSACCDRGCHRVSTVMGNWYRPPQRRCRQRANHQNAVLVRDKVASGQGFALCMPGVYVVSTPAADDRTAAETTQWTWPSPRLMFAQGIFIH